ncbi:MAG: hypothetical protein PUB08_00425 [Firmicutes bacterium]|nr:hypothetical protein [Bacillota bacterium]
MDHCICCGSPIPEGRLVCPACEAEPEKISARMKNSRRSEAGKIPEYPPFSGIASVEQTQNKTDG